MTVHANPTGWREAVTVLSRSDDASEIERLCGEFPKILSEEALAQVDSEIDAIEAGGPGDWWGLTRGVQLLRGAAAGVLDDALFRVRTRDLMPLGPDDVEEMTQRHPELLGRHADILLRHWASQQSDPHRQQQMELRRELLRRLAAPAFQGIHAEAMEAEQEHGRTGSRAALDRALAILRDLLTDRAPFIAEEHVQGTQQGLSRLLQRRFTVTGNLGDLDEAVDVAADGADAVSHAMVRGALLTELGNSLNVRFRELGAREDVDRAIAAFTEVGTLPLPAGGDPDDAVTNTVNLGTVYLDRGFHFGDPADLDRALEIAREVVAATPPASPRRWSRLNSLASALRAVGRHRSDPALLSEALELQREAMGTPDPTQRAHIAAGLAQTLEAAAEAGLSVDDADEAYRVACLQGLEVNLHAAVWAGMSWGRGAWAAQRWGGAAEAYGYVAQAVRQYLRHQREESQQEIRLSQFREVGARAAYALAKVGRVGDAVLAFELSRAQLLAEAMSESGMGSPGQTTAPETGDVALTVDEVRTAAGGRDLVYLVPIEFGGVALLVREAGIAAIDLPALTAEAVGWLVQEQLKGSVATESSRAWLWGSVMAPVLEEVGDSAGLVVVAGGLLGLLPLHVASTPDPSRPSGQRYVLDVLPLTFAPSARSLRGSAPASLPEGGQTLVVANPQPVSGDRLDLAPVEAATVLHLLPGATVLHREGATLPAVLTALPSMRTVHFACHGRADPDVPLRGGLALAGDELLTVNMLRASSLSRGTAVLSACETGVPGAALPDEAVGLPSALLQAGLTTVIASLWSVPDHATAILMIELYRRMVREGETPATALRGAQQWVRDTTDAEKAATWEAAVGDWLPEVVTQWLLRLVEPGEARNYADPAQWAAFIHVGA